MNPFKQDPVTGWYYIDKNYASDLNNDGIDDDLGACELEPGGGSMKATSIKWGSQEKYFPGHNSYTPGRSTMTADPAKLAQKAGTGKQVGKIKVGQPGSKERVNFGEKIGTYIDQTGNSSPTMNGIIHYSKDGIHIVPARP